MDMTVLPAALVGHWLVRREAGLLPGLGLSKVIRSDGRGVTRVLGLPLLPFRIRMGQRGEGAELRYWLLPLRDELRPDVDGWLGRGLLFEHEFCRFRLVRPPAPTLPAVGPAPHF
jgi:hypothetical protein